MIGTLINIFNYVYHNYYIYQYRTDIAYNYLHLNNRTIYKWKYDYDEELVLYYLLCEDNYSQNILIPALVRKHYKIVKYIISKNNMMSKYYMDYFINLDYNIFIEIINISSKENINNIFRTLLQEDLLRIN